MPLFHQSPTFFLLKLLLHTLGLLILSSNSINFYIFFEFCSRFKNSCLAKFFKTLNLSLHVTILFNLTYCCDWFKNNGFWFECFLILHFQSHYVHISCSSYCLSPAAAPFCWRPIPTILYSFLIARSLAVQLFFSVYSLKLITGSLRVAVDTFSPMAAM